MITKCPTHTLIVEESAVESADSTTNSAAYSLRIVLWVRAFIGRDGYIQNIHIMWIHTLTIIIVFNVMHLSNRGVVVIG